MSLAIAGSAGVFENESVPPPVGRTNFSLENWDKVRSRGIQPEFRSRLTADAALRMEFLVGARMMGYELVDLDDAERVAELKAMNPRRYPIQPQQLLMVDALNAEGFDEFVVEMMRRGSKTTTIFCWLLGRCASRTDYQVTFSAQSGVKGSARLREWKIRLDKTSPDPESDIPPWRRGENRVSKRVLRHAALFGDDDLVVDQTPDKRGFRILMGEVGKGIYFDNGSQFLVLKPDAEAYRGEAGDVSWVDEAQELDPVEGAELFAGIVPLQDTKEGSAIVVSGTAGEVRAGPFWERVERLRNSDPDIGGVDYCAPEDTPWELVEDEEQALELLQRVHPGIGTLTTEAKMRKNWRKLGKPQWAREYLSMWPVTFGARAIPQEPWDTAAMAKVARPQRVAFGLAIKPGGSVACIMAAWRDASGTAYVEVVAHQPGTAWIPKRAQELTRTYRGSSIAYDDIAEGKATATEMLSLSPRPKTRIQLYRETAAGCVQFMRELDRGTLKHFDQVGLNEAVACAARREVRGDQGVWLWTVTDFKDDITPLDAATKALRNWDQHYAGKTSGATPIMAA